VFIDEAGRLLGRLGGALGAGEGAAFLREVLGACRRAGRFVLLPTPLPIPGWAPSGGERIVFPPADPHHAALAGISKEFSAPGPPGRAVAIRAGAQVVVQLALPAGQAPE